MLTKLKLTSAAALSLAVMGVAMLGSVGSAQAAGCLQDGQAHYSLIEADDNDAALDVNAAGFACETGNSVLSYSAGVQTELDTSLLPAEAQQRFSARTVQDDTPRESLVSSND
jgi:hypothetical protein